MTESLPETLVSDAPSSDQTSKRMLPVIDLTERTPAGSLAAARLGFALTKAHLLARRPMLALMLGIAVTISGAVIERTISSVGSVDRSLHATFRLVLPLLAFALANDATGRMRLAEATWPVARFGVSRRAVALGIILCTALFTALAGATLAATTAIVGHGSAAPSLLRDVLVCTWIGGLTGAAYASWYSLGGTFFQRGRGRLIPLLADLLFGGSTALTGAILPRGNAINLLGGPAPMNLTQPQSALLLALSALVLAILAALRCKE